MNKSGKIVIISLVVLLLSIIGFFIVQVRKLINADWTYAGFKITNLSLQKVTITLYLKVENDGVLSVAVANQNYDAYLNNNFVSKITNNQPFLIKPGVSYMPLELDINLADAIKAGWQNLLSLVTDKTKANIIIKGTCELKLGLFSIKDMTIDLSFNLGDKKEAV
jgi:LEA14-like dessication related protein